MTMRPFTDARGGLNHLVDAQIGRAFPVVHKVYQHLDAIEYVAQVYEAGRARDIVLRTNRTKEWIEWQYKGEAKWTILFKFSDLLGADIADVVAAEQAIAAELVALRAYINQTRSDTLAASDRAQAAELGAVVAKDAAETAQADAETAEALARAWATKIDGPVLNDGVDKFSAQYWATQSEQSALDAADANAGAQDALANHTAAADPHTQYLTKAESTDVLATKVDAVMGKQLSTEDYTTPEKSKLAGIAPGATANATDAQLRDRTTHTGAQAISTVTGLQLALDSKESAGTAAAAIAAHVATSDPHPNYTTTAEASAAAPVQSVAGKTGAITLVKADVGLGNVDNTSDANKPVSAATQTALNTKVDKVAGKGLSTEDYTTAEKTKLAGVAAGAQVNTVISVAGKTGAVTLAKTDVGLANVDNTSDANKPVSTATQAALDTKVDKVAGKQLSTEDYTSAEKAKLASVENGANAYIHPAKHPASIITQDENNRFVTDAEKAAWNAKQAALVSGINIKKINGESLLGDGDLVVTGSGGGGPTLQGDTAPYTNQTKLYQITNYSSFSSYAVSASAGTASISGDTITYTAPSMAGGVVLTLTVDGQPAVFVINVQAVPSYIPTPTPTPTNFGDPLEGGFYAGMVWGQIAQSSTSMAIATGSKTFTVADMSSAPIVYVGQMVEVRSRANPANKFVGTVTSAAGTSLTINVTSIGGSGTFSDWSVMARHRVIVAPKASGEHAGIALKNANTALPTACQTLTEGFAATQAMRDADSSTVYPAAHWARNLNIGGRTDWYIPARDELELCWRNLKPVTGNNYAEADRLATESVDYTNNGSYGDTADTHGTNNNSSPTGAAYTATVPAQTTAAAFRTGGAEAFGSSDYWSSSDCGAYSAWFQYWHPSIPGLQSESGKFSAYRVRAVRRSVI